MNDSVSRITPSGRRSCWVTELGFEVRPDIEIAHRMAIPALSANPTVGPWGSRGRGPRENGAGWGQGEAPQLALGGLRCLSVAGVPATGLHPYRAPRAPMGPDVDKWLACRTPRRHSRRRLPPLPEPHGPCTPAGGSALRAVGRTTVTNPVPAVSHGLRSCAAPVRRGPPLSGNGQAAVLPRNRVGCTDPAARMVMRPQQSPAATRPRTPWPEDPGWLRHRAIAPAPSCRKGAVIPCAARHQPCGFPGSLRGHL